MNNFATFTASSYEEAKQDEELSALFSYLYRHFKGQLNLRLWDGNVLQLGQPKKAGEHAGFTIDCCHPSAARSILMDNNPLGLVDAYFRGDINIEGDIYAALGIQDQLNAMQTPLREKCYLLLNMLRLRNLQHERLSQQSSIYMSSRVAKAHSNIQHHETTALSDDVANEFYALWLDIGMVCPRDDVKKNDEVLSLFADDKLDQISSKLKLKQGDYLLDIGCGWGALAVHAAKYYGVKVHGITCSRQQVLLARNMIANAGLSKQITITLNDYQEINGEAIYDKIASVGIFEHIGLNNLSHYFSSIHRLLKPNGLFLNQVITHDINHWKKNLSTAFMSRYVFPDGELKSITSIQCDMEKAGFEMTNLASLRQDYAMSLRRWVAQLERQHTQTLQYVSESTYRIWHFYMAASALEFESGELDIYQTLVMKRKAEQSYILGRHRHLYLNELAAA